MYKINIITSEENRILITDNEIIVTIRNDTKNIDLLCKNLSRFIQDATTEVTYDKTINLDQIKQLLSSINKTIEGCTTNNNIDMNIIDDFYPSSTENKELMLYEPYKKNYKDKTSNNMNNAKDIFSMIKQNISLFRRIKSSSDIIVLVWKLYKVRLTVIESSTILVRLIMLII